MSASSTTATPLSVLGSVFGYPTFRGPQAAIIDHIVAGGDALVLMPTGGGKSLCYQIPALLRQGVGVVISPLIALMQDQVDAMLQVGVRAAFLNSSLDWKTASDTERRLMNGELDLIYVAPERLMTDRFLDLLDDLSAANRIALFAIDEAHCVSQWGHDFRPEYIQLSMLHQRFPRVPRIALTATADELTRQEIITRLGLDAARIFISSFDRPNICYTVVERDNPRKQLLDFLQDHRGEAGIVYCLSRKKVDETAIWLSLQGINALPYHAGLDAQTRQTHQQRFLREDAIVMVATIAFGMGIDKPDVRFVAHLDLPKSLEAYYQETGRAGRDGEPAEAWMTYGLNDVVIHRQRIDESISGEEQKHVERGKLDALLAWCETANCRRTLLLKYFSEDGAPCGNCDTCLEPPELWDGTVAAQKALSAVFRSGQRFGAGHLIDLLRGKRTDKIEQNAHEHLSTFGIGVDMDETAWRGVFRQLLAGGYLHADAANYGGLRLTDAARPVLKGEATLSMRRPALKTSDKSRREKSRQLEGARSVGFAQPTRSTGAEQCSANSPFHRRQKDTSRAFAAAELVAKSPQAIALVDALRLWRSALAREQGVPAFVILHDKTLHELAARMPQSTSELLAVPGIGQAKAERYGDAILEIVTAQADVSSANGALVNG